MPVIVPPGVTLQGSTYTNLWPNEYGTPGGSLAVQSQILPVTAFSGDSVIKMVDQSTGGYSAASGNQVINNITINGANLSGGSVNGFEWYGSIIGVTMNECSVSAVPGHGYAVVSHTGAGIGYGDLDQLFATNCIAYAVGGDGFHFNGLSDSIFVGCMSIGNTGNAWYSFLGNHNYFTNCRAEWSAIGWRIDFPSGENSVARMGFEGCSTDYNSGDGWYFTGAQTGGIVTMTGCIAHADGHTGGTATAGFHFSGTGYPILLTGCGAYIDATDAGTNPYGPAYGIHAGSTPTTVAVGDTYVQGYTAGINWDHTGTYYTGTNVIAVTGGSGTVPTAGVIQPVTGWGVAPSGDTTGATDHANINAITSAAGGVAHLAPGHFYLNAPITPATNTAILGSGMGATTISPANSGWSGAALITATASSSPFITVADLTLQGLSATYSSNPAAAGIVVNNNNVTVRDVTMAYLNGWAVVVENTTTQGSNKVVIQNVFAYTCASGCQLNGQGIGGGAWYLSNCNFENVQSGDGLQIVNVHDVTIVNQEGTVVNGAGNSIDIIGDVAAVYIANFDLGPYPTNTSQPVINIQAASTTVAAGSNGGEISTIASWSHPSAGVLDVASTASMPNAGQITVAASGATTAVVNYTGKTGTGLTGCTYVSGSATGTVATGGAVISQAFPYMVHFTSGLVIGGTPGVAMSAGNNITFDSVDFNQNGGTGINGSGAVDQVTIANCQFVLNGQTAGTNYEIAWSSTGKMLAHHNTFNTPVGTAASQVTACVNATAGATIVDNNTVANTAPLFSSGYAKIARNNFGYNPIGAVGPPAFPATTVALTNPYGSDATVYIKAGTGGITNILTGGNTTGIALASGGQATVFVPVTQSITVDYPSGTCTWVWMLS